MGYNEWDMDSTLASPSEVYTVTTEPQRQPKLWTEAPTPIFQQQQQVSLISASPWLPTSGINVLLMAASEF